MARQRKGNGTENIVIGGTSVGIENGNNGNDSVNASDGTIIIDPADIGDGGNDAGSSGSSTGDAPKRRGRKPGSASARNSKKTAALDINGVEAILYSAHSMLAGITRSQELALDKEEAHNLADAISKVSAHYDMQATQKSLDWANLLMTCGMIYGPRLIAMRLRKSSEKKQRGNQAATAETDNPYSTIIIPGVGEFGGMA